MGDGTFLLGQDLGAITIEPGERDSAGTWTFGTVYDLRPFILQIQPRIRRQGTEVSPVWSILENNITTLHGVGIHLEVLQDSAGVQILRTVSVYKYCRVTWEQGEDPTPYQVVVRIADSVPGGITQKGANTNTLDGDPTNYGQSETALGV